MTAAAERTTGDPPLRTSPRIRLDRVRKSFSLGGQLLVVLAGIDLEVDDGEFVCLVGPSGRGKTTLLRMLGGLESANKWRWRLVVERLLSMVSPIMLLTVWEVAARSGGGRRTLLPSAKQDRPVG